MSTLKSTKTSTKTTSSIDTTGIDLSKVGKMQTSLENYIKAVNKALSSIDSVTKKLMNNAVKGASTQKTITNYLTKVENDCKATLKQLNQFKTALGNLKGSYSKNDVSNTSFKL